MREYVNNEYILMYKCLYLFYKRTYTYVFVYVKFMYYVETYLWIYA
jgi:hypothetical protein